MNVSEFTELLQDPSRVQTPVQTHQLEDILQEYPYFQAAHALRLKGLRNLNSFKYNNSLKVTAAYTADRDVLFDFITSEEFLQNAIADTISGKALPLSDHQVISEEVVPNEKADARLIEETEDHPLPQSVKDADAILDPALFKSKDPEIDLSLAEEKRKAEKELEIGKPLSFTKEEKYSFAEWLQLTTLETISKKGEPNDEVEEESPEAEDEDLNTRDEKFKRIDKFLAGDQKIIPDDSATAEVDLKSSNKLQKQELMTETLARVYLEQKKYKKAIQAYRILSLKYPEKSSFFANRIKAVEQLQKDNKN